MKIKHIDLFFNTLSEKWKNPTRIILIGGASSLLMGGTRPTNDVDFEVNFEHTEKLDKNLFQKAVKETTKDTEIAAQFSENIERWGEISLLDYHQHIKSYKKFNLISVYLLEVEYWSIGKISRYWEQDIQDMIAVFKNNHTDPLTLLEVWTSVLHKSPLSSQLSNTKKQIKHFFTTFGKKIWGKNYPEEKIREKLT